MLQYNWHIAESSHVKAEIHISAHIQCHPLQRQQVHVQRILPVLLNLHKTEEYTQPEHFLFAQKQLTGVLLAFRILHLLRVSCLLVSDTCGFLQG